MPNSNITEVYSKMKFQSIDEKKVFATGFMIRGFFFVFSRSIFGFRGFRSFSCLNGFISKKRFFGVSWVRILSKKGWTDFVADDL